MSMTTFLVSLEQSRIGQAMSGESGWVWLFPTVETLHVLAMAVVFGSIAMVDLRLIGLTTRDRAVSELTADLLPYTWSAFGLAVLTGSLMFLSRANTYFYNWAFAFKMLCLVLAGINMAIVTRGALRNVLRWDWQLPPASARAAGAISIVLWASVILFGRWIGFST